VNESTPYAGIEFALTISPDLIVITDPDTDPDTDPNEDDMTFTFTPGPEGTSVAPLRKKDGLYYCGYWIVPTSNVLPAGDNLAGTLHFSGYTGDQELIISVKEMNVTRLDEDNKAITTVYHSPYVFNIQREYIPPIFHAITWNADGGSPAPAQTSVSHGGAITQPSPMTKSGYTFDGWFANANLTGAAVIFPVSNVTSAKEYWAKWTLTPTVVNPVGPGPGPGSTVTYTVTFDPDGGIRIGGGQLTQTVSSGAAATAPILAREGYTFDGWDRTFTNVTANMTVKAQWLEDEEITDDGPPLGEFHVHYFDDVTYTRYAWAEPAVCALAEAGVVKGTANRIYSPASKIKRGDFILMLARAYGFDEPFTENFPDVPVGSYYYNSIGSAKALGVAEGYGDGTFRPEAPISRQEMMAFIDRTMDTIDNPLPRGSEKDLLAFSDHNLVAGYAREHVAALINSGVIIGSNNNRINPRGNTTRAEMAVALYRLMILTGHMTAGDTPVGETHVG